MKNHCSVSGCIVKYYAKGYCEKHYKQMRDYGKILERTIHDPNEFIIDGDICWVVLYNNRCIEIARAKFPTIYYETLKDYKWHIRDGYAEAAWYDEDRQQHNITLHASVIYLSGKILQPREEIDHKDQDKLNCLFDNLRICNRSQNQQNRGKQLNNTSGWKGVSWHERIGKWQAAIKVNYVTIPLGYFDTAEDAARAYNIAAIKYHGEFAVLNKV